MLRFDLSAYYSLLDVFDRTGRLMFPIEWTGLEAWARDTESPETLKEKRQALLKEITTLKKDMSPLHDLMRLNLSESELQETSDDLGRLSARLKDAKVDLAQIPQVTDTWVTDHAAYSRREKVERELSQALIRNDLQIIVGTHMVIPWTEWCQRPDFRVYYGLSMVRIPKGESTLRRGPGLIDRTAFDLWSERFATDNTASGDLTAEAKLAEWLKAEVRANPQKSKTVEEYRQEALNSFGGLSARAFNRVWAATVPDSWRQGGRMPGN